MPNPPNIAAVPAAILAGGLATRLRPITEKIPKALVEVAGKPFIDHHLSLLRENGIRQVVICAGYKGEMLRDHVGNGSAFDLRVDYSFDGEKLLGTAGALKRAAHLLGEVFWVTYGDSYMDIDYRTILDFFLARNVLGLMTVIENGDRWDKSNAVFEHGRLVRYDKQIRSPEMKHIDYGVALLCRAVLDGVPLDQPTDLAGIYTNLVEAGQMVGHEVFNRFYEMGSPQGLQETRAYLLSRNRTSEP